MKRLNLIRLGIITLILYSLTIMIYFLYFYKPIEPISKGTNNSAIINTNEIIMSVNRSNLIFFLVISLMLCFLTSLFISILFNEIVLYFKPTFTVYAKLKSKEAVMSTSGNHRGFSYVGYNYILNFELDDGSELAFQVLPKHYMTILEGNKGIVKYNEAIVKRFIGFDLKEIE
jgi:hypothetical protein